MLLLLLVYFFVLFCFVFVKGPRICSVCHSYNPVLISAFTTFHRIYTKIVSQQVTLVEQGLLTLLEHLRLLLVFSGVHVAQYLAFCVMFYRSLFVFLAIVLSVLRFTASDYPIGVFNIFLRYHCSFVCGSNFEICQ